MTLILFNLYAEYLMKEALAEAGDFNIRGRIINKVRFADDEAIIAKKTRRAVRYDERIG